MSSENPSGVISLPRIQGGVVTRMTVLPSNWAICYLEVETSESSISFPDPLKFDVDAEINIQRIVIVGSSGLDHQ
jgi:hypothetical protein